jgi:hypothetical protein
MAMTLHDFNVYPVNKLQRVWHGDPKPFIVHTKDGKAEVHANGWQQALEMVAEVRRHGVEITEVNYVKR